MATVSVPVIPGRRKLGDGLCATNLFLPHLGEDVVAVGVVGQSDDAPVGQVFVGGHLFDLEVFVDLVNRVRDEVMRRNPKPPAAMTWGKPN